MPTWRHGMSGAPERALAKARSRSFPFQFKPNGNQYLSLTGGPGVYIAFLVLEIRPYRVPFYVQSLSMCKDLQCQWDEGAVVNYKRARVSLPLRLICGYFLRSLLSFLTFLLWNITGR